MFANKAPFPFHVFKRTKLPLPGKLALIFPNIPLALCHFYFSEPIFQSHLFVDLLIQSHMTFLMRIEDFI